MEGNHIITSINNMRNQVLDLQHQMVSCQNRVRSMELKADALIIQRGGVPGFPPVHPVNQGAHDPAQGPGFPPLYPCYQGAHGQAQGPPQG